MPTSQDITQLLIRAKGGDTNALDELLPLVYRELYDLARLQRRRTSSETLNTTALVHEAYEKIARQDAGWNDKAHFFRVAAKAMRDIIVDYARRQTAAKRGGDASDLSLENIQLVAPERADEVVALDEALGRLSALDERQSEVVQLRYFVGLTIEETADVLGLSTATIKREWTAARAWLHQEISQQL